MKNHSVLTPELVPGVPYENSAGTDFTSCRGCGIVKGVSRYQLKQHSYPVCESDVCKQTVRAKIIDDVARQESGRQSDQISFAEIILPYIGPTPRS